MSNYMKTANDAKEVEQNLQDKFFPASEQDSQYNIKDEHPSIKDDKDDYYDDPLRGQSAEVNINWRNLSKRQRDLLFKIEGLLGQMGVGFDTGGGCGGRDWEWDWSLSGPLDVTFRRFRQAEFDELAAQLDHQGQYRIASIIDELSLLRENTMDAKTAKELDLIAQVLDDRGSPDLAQRIDQLVLLTADKKWIQKAVKHPGRVHKYLGVSEGENIPKGKIQSALDKLKAKKDKNKEEISIMRTLQLAMRFQKGGDISSEK
jgi:hypothetical protein